MSAWALLGHNLVDQATAPGGTEEGGLVLALVALLHWCDQQGHSFPESLNQAHLMFNQNVLNLLSEQGKIVLGDDGKYRTPEHHANRLRLVSSNDP